MAPRASRGPRSNLFGFGFKDYPESATQSQVYRRLFDTLGPTRALEVLAQARAIGKPGVPLDLRQAELATRRGIPEAPWAHQETINRITGARPNSPEPTRAEVRERVYALLQQAGRYEPTDRYDVFGPFSLMYQNDSAVIIFAEDRPLYGLPKSMISVQIPYVGNAETTAASIQQAIQDLTTRLDVTARELAGKLKSLTPGDDAWISWPDIQRALKRTKGKPRLELAYALSTLARGPWAGVRMETRPPVQMEVDTALVLYGPQQDRRVMWFRFAPVSAPAPILAQVPPPPAASSSGSDLMWGTPGTWEYLHRVFVANVMRANHEGRSDDVQKLAAAFLAASRSDFGGRKAAPDENKRVAQALSEMGLRDLPTVAIPKLPRSNRRYYPR